MGQIKNIKLHIVTDIKCSKGTKHHLVLYIKMRYVAAYLLSALGGNDSPTTDDIKTILESVGVGYDDERAEIVVNQCKGKSINELIAAGSEKMASMPAGGGGGGAAAPASAAGGDAPAAVEEKKEEKKESSDEGSDDDMGFGLFD